MTIITHHSYISELVVISKFPKSRIDILLEVIPLQTKLFRHSYRRTVFDLVESYIEPHILLWDAWGKWGKPFDQIYFPIVDINMTNIYVCAKLAYSTERVTSVNVY